MLSQVRRAAQAQEVTVTRFQRLFRELEMKTPRPNGGDVIFRRYRRVPGGGVLDAQKYGLRAWPIRVRPKRPK